MEEKRALEMKNEMDEGLKELTKRKLAVSSFIKSLRIGSSTQNYDDKIWNFAKGMLKEFRFRKCNEYIGDERPFDLIKCSVDFASKFN